MLIAASPRVSFGAPTPGYTGLPRPTPSLSWLANWSMYIQDDPNSFEEQIFAIDQKTLQTLSKYVRSGLVRARISSKCVHKV